ncbi:MAG: hypothetical protein ACI915_000399, partial [Gammaproteobacteria bacterium]
PPTSLFLNELLHAAIAILAARLGSFVKQVQKLKGLVLGRESLLTMVHKAKLKQRFRMPGP